MTVAKTPAATAKIPPCRCKTNNDEYSYDKWQRQQYEFNYNMLPKQQPTL